MKFVNEYKGFKVGDRVKVVSKISIPFGRTGVINKIKPDAMIPIDLIIDGVPFDGHNGWDGDCSTNHWFVYPGYIEKIPNTKYQIGDVVKVISCLNQCHKYGGVTPSSQMITKAGKEVKIKSITKTGRYKIEGSCFTWTDEMFEGKVEDLVKKTEKTKKTDKDTKITKKSSRTIVTVRFDSFGKEYYYLTTDKTIHVGVDVVVPVGSGNHEKVARVTSVGKYRASTIEIPVSELKYVLRKGHVCYTKNFDWDKFRSGNLIVEVDSIEKMETFLSEFKKNGCTEVSDYDKGRLERHIKEHGSVSFVYDHYRENHVTIESEEWHSIDRPGVMTFKWDKVVEKTVEKKVEDKQPYKYNVGDIVKATTNNYVITNKNNGWCGIVTKVSGETFNAKTIKGDEFGFEFHGLYMKDFELMK